MCRGTRQPLPAVPKGGGSHQGSRRMLREGAGQGWIICSLQPAVSPSPSLYDTTSGLDGIDVGISLDTCNCWNCNHHSKQDRSCTDCPVRHCPGEQRSNMGRNLALPTRTNTAFRANPSLPARGDVSPCGRRDLWSMLRSINAHATMRLVEIDRQAGSAGIPELTRVTPMTIKRCERTSSRRLLPTRSVGPHTSKLASH